jgi:hypothetical protein
MSIFHVLFTDFAARFEPVDYQKLISYSTDPKPQITLGLVFCNGLCVWLNYDSCDRKFLLFKIILRRLGQRSAFNLRIRI